MPSIFYLSWIKKRKTKNNCLQTSGNCHPKSILALEIVVGKKNVHLLLSILEREISQQFQASCFACTQFIRSIWDTRGRRIFPLVGILRLRKWPKRLYFPLSSEAVSNRYCRTCSPSVWMCGKIPIASMTMAMLSEIYREWGKVSWQQWISWIRKNVLN